MTLYIEVSLPVPLRRTFVYLPAKNTKSSDYIIGSRVKVPFGKGNKSIVGIVSNIYTEYKLNFKLKNIINIIDTKAIITSNIVKLINFAHKYYHYPIGEIYFSCMPGLIKQGEDINKYSDKQVQLNTDVNFLKDNVKLSPSQTKLINILNNNNSYISLFALEQLGIKTNTINSLLKNNYIIVKSNTKKTNNASENNLLKQKPLNLNQEQQAAVNTVIQATDNFANFKTFLLYGITGSGKTEVYFHLIHQVLQQNKQVLLLVPEISLTPQTINRFKNRFNANLAVIHSKVSIKSKTQDWLAAKTGEARIIIGTRSAIFTPIANLGIIIVDEEHDQSFKQQESFKYNGRDLAVIRAKQSNIPIVLGSATPSIESVANVASNKYTLLKLLTRAGGACLPKLCLLNTKHKKLAAGLSDDLIKQIKTTLDNNEQVLLFLNRRGFAPVLKCNDCDWAAICDRCNVYYTIHKQENLLSCHHCDKSIRLISNCSDCGSLDLGFYGVGTEQIEVVLNNLFKDYKTIRIDRDTVKSDKDLNNYIKEINNNTPKILLGTQMLAKGHHFPNVTLVAVVDADSSLFSTDFRAPERLTQLLLQVAGRAGRENKPGRVVIQTSQPEHNLLQDILHKNYWDIAQDLYNLRLNTGLPPCSTWVIIRAESYQLDTTLSFLNNVKSLLNRIISEQPNNSNKINLMGPTPSQRFKKAGLFRGQLIISINKQNNSMAVLQTVMSNFLDAIDNSSDKIAKNVKWTLDVDPYEVY